MTCIHYNIDQWTARVLHFNVALIPINVPNANRIQIEVQVEQEWVLCRKAVRLCTAEKLSN